MTDQISPDPTAIPSRRQVVSGVLAGGIALPLLSACGSGGGNKISGSSGGTGGSGGSGGSTKAASGKPLAKTSQIPVGEGKIFPAEKVVVTQPTAGHFKCFSAVCTHQGCIVADVSNGDIHCTCHGSAFSIKDGSVVSPPATSPLAEKKIKVTGGEISLA